MADSDIEGSSLAAIIANELRSARTFEDTELEEKRTLALQYMRGEMPDVPARPNGSTQTSRDFADTHSWILPGAVRVFTASDQMVQYDKVREENDDWSRDATEYTNWSFFRENNGYRVLYNATSDSLMLGNGLAASYWEAERTEARWFRDKTEFEVSALLEEDWQPTGVVKPGKPATEEVDGVVLELPTLTVKLQKQSRPAKICDITCKPENLYLNSTATEIETARFVAYLHDDKTRSDLMDMADDYGWDKDRIQSLPGYGGRVREVDVGRDGDLPMDYSSPFKSGDLIDLYECYIRVDVDGDGVAEFVQAWWAGGFGDGALLSDDEYDGECPYTDIPCYPMPHRWDAQSVFDRTADIQRVKTVLLRQSLDNLYASNLPMREVEAGTVDNPDILVNPKFGGIIWRKAGKAAVPIVNHAVPFVADKSFAAMQYMDEMIAKRTGVSRTTMALDPEALQNQTATAAQQQRDAGYSQIELIARNMAELGWAKFFRKRLALAIRNGLVRQIPAKVDEPADPSNPNGPVKQKMGFRDIDASKWDPSMAVTINVGLGTGSRDRDMAMLNTILQGQVGMADRLGQAGMTDKAIEFIPKIRNTAVKIAESSGLKNPEEFYPPFTDQDVAKAKNDAAQAAQQPDPKIQLEQEKAKADIAIQQEKTQASNVQAQQDFQLKQMQLEAEIQLKREQLAAELQLKREQMIAELALQRELGHANAAAKVEASRTSGVHVGGEPG